MTNSTTTSDTPDRRPERPAEGAGEQRRGPTMPPLCDEYSGGGGSFPDTRDRVEPGHKNGDCDRIGNVQD